ncbi:MAG TPA: aminodeoxychorismate synthase component I [Anaerolineales bacterium]|nr:aminodeoxychorismate synthase component I [Anaerolineales bacterium]
MQATLDMDKIYTPAGLIKTNEFLLHENGNWLHFTKPQQIIIARELNEVFPALLEVEQLIQANDWYAAGFVSYEAASAFDSALQTQPSGGFPYLWFGLYPEPRLVTLPQPEGPPKTLNWQPTLDRECYNLVITRIKEEIAKGRTYQVNYTMHLQTNFMGEAWDFFLHLSQNQNHQAAYVDTGRYVVCSASPELFFQLDRDTITCRPMKGTTGRGRATREDRECAKSLKNSEKNRAENVMIVDMIRNDLGRIAKIGTVCVPELFQAERYPTLWQLTSTVTAKTDATITEIFTALFPCASITGAPKVSTMRIIAELENSPRKIYTGSVGYISPGRKAKFNVAIRTALIDREERKAEYGVGGGIVWDSTSMDEYEEALLKARVLTNQQPAFSLLETMLWTPEGGFFLRDKHLARMLDSADYFGISIRKEKLEEYLESISSSFHTSQRVRLLLDQAGKLSSETKSLVPEKNTKILKVCLAQQAVDSSNLFLFHKTTQRGAYESARRGCEEWDDVLLYNLSSELTEFTIGNLVVELEGQLLTPPISCGVLPGTFRAHLVETGQVVERPISVEQLDKCTKVFRVNSVRKWQRAKFHKRAGK